MNANRLTRISFSTVSVLLCAALISSCGASKESKNKGETTAAPVAADGGGPANPQTPPVQTPVDPAAPKGRAEVTEGTTVATEEQGQAAHVGRIQSENIIDNKKTADKNSIPDFKEAEAIKTGGQVGELSYTANSDDGVMEHFRAVAKTVKADQQQVNLRLAQMIVGAKFKNGSLDLAIQEDEKKIYKLKATTEGDKMKLSLVSGTGDLEFEGGFVKCLDASCDNSYAKIKFNGAYTRIIFRTANMVNHFNIQENIQEEGFDLWKNYILSSVQGSANSAKIDAVKTSSYEIVNGKSAMGIQLTTQDNEAVVLNTLLVAPAAGTELNQKITKVTDLSMNYNLAATTGKANTLSSKISDVSLVNNNGKGQVKVKLTFGAGSIWMVLSKVKSKSMSVAEIQAFEKTVPNF